MELEVSEKKEYDLFLLRCDSVSFLQSWEWGEWQKVLGREVFRFFLVRDGVRIGSVQFIKMQIFSQSFYLYAPYGPSLSLEFSRQDWEDFFCSLKVLFSENWFFRIEPLDGKNLNFPKDFRKSLNIQPAVSLISDLAKTTEEILSGMHHKTRYNIRLAEKKGVVVRELAFHNSEELGKALDLIVATQERQSFRGHPREYYKKMGEFFAKGDLENLQFKILFSEFEGEMLSTGIFFDFCKTRVYLFGGSADARKELMAPYLLHFFSMMDAKAKGLLFYDWGGSEVSSGGVRGFTRFKSGFGGREVVYAGAYDLVNNRLKYVLYVILRKIRRMF